MEGVVDTHPLDTEDLGEQRAQHLLGLALGGLLRSAFREVGGGQGPAVHLAVGSDGQARTDDDRHGDHVGGQDEAHLPPHLLHVGLVSVGDDVADQTPLAGLVLARHGDRLGHARLGRQHGFHLGQFHPETPDLHLVIGPPDEHRLSVAVPARQVSSAVHALTGEERACDEPLGRQVRPAEVAAGQAGAGDVQLAGDPRRDRPQEGVEDVDLAVRHGTADRQLTPDPVTGLDRLPRRAQGGLGRPVGVPHPQTGLGPPQVLHREGGNDVPAGTDLDQACEAFR